MKKLITLITMGMLFLGHTMAQSSKQVWSEDFNSSLPPSNWTVNPTGSWVSETTHFVTDFSSVNSQSYLGLVPHQTNSSTILETPYYDFSNYTSVFLRFSHICKISPQDTARIEYRIGIGRWNVLPRSAYRGSALTYSTYFNADPRYADLGNTFHPPIPILYSILAVSCGDILQI